MKIQVVSKIVFQRGMDYLGVTNDNVADKNVAIISISEPSLKGEKGYHYLKNNKNVLNLDFHDIDEPCKDYTHFTKEMAKEIIDFVNKNEDKKTLIIHCHAGISRSGAVGLAINEYLGQDYKEFKKQNPQVIPNTLVTKIFNELAISPDTSQ